MWKKSALLVAIAACTGHALADLKNISSSGVHSGTSLEAVACTIVGSAGALYRGKKILYVFAESTGNGKDPMLKVSSLKYNYVLQNDDWEEEYYINGSPQSPVLSSLYSSFLRNPRRATDAAVVFIADVGEPLCAFTKEYANDSNLYQVQISITDVTATVTAAGIRSASSLSADPNGMLRADLDHIIDSHQRIEK